MKAKRSIEVSLNKSERTSATSKEWDTASCLYSRKILVANSVAASGEISEILLHPLRGSLLGVIVKTAAGQFFHAEASALKPKEQFLILESAVPPVTTTMPSFAQGIIGVHRHLLGATVVTTQGQLLGKIDDLCWQEPGDKVYYHITESGLSRLFGNDFWIAGNFGVSWFETERRLIVSPEVEILHLDQLSKQFSADAPSDKSRWQTIVTSALSSLARLLFSWRARSRSAISSMPSGENS